MYFSYISPCLTKGLSFPMQVRTSLCLYNVIGIQNLHQNPFCRLSCSALWWHTGGMKQQIAWKHKSEKTWVYCLVRQSMDSIFFFLRYFLILCFFSYKMTSRHSCHLTENQNFGDCKHLKTTGQKLVFMRFTPYSIISAQPSADTEACNKLLPCTGTLL